MKEVNSMPTNPVLGKGEAWTREKNKKVLGKVVLVGFVDSPPLKMFVTKIDNNNWPAQGFVFEDKQMFHIDTPNQIISISDIKLG